MEQATTIGLDIAKHVFQVHGADAAGHMLFRKRITRVKLLGFLAAQAPCVVAMEAWAGQMTASDNAQQRSRHFPLPERGRPQMESRHFGPSPTSAARTERSLTTRRRGGSWGGWSNAQRLRCLPERRRSV